MHHYFTAAERVEAEGFGTGTIIKDERVPDPLQAPVDRVWVLLDVGNNPTAFRSSELELVVE